MEQVESKITKDSKSGEVKRGNIDGEVEIIGL